MQLVQIRYFLAACQTANFSQAAKLCEVTQPALTRGIQALEQEMGGVFFRREHYRTKLTPFGQVMRTHFERIQQHTEALLEKAQHYKQTAGTMLSIGLMRGVRAEPVRKILNDYAKALYAKDAPRTAKYLSDDFAAFSLAPPLDRKSVV